MMIHRSCLYHLFLFCIFSSLFYNLNAFPKNECRSVRPGSIVEGRVNFQDPQDCYIIAKPPFTREIMMIDTAVYDTREGYYICTSADGGAIGSGCSTSLRSQGQSLCLSVLDGYDNIQVNVSCNQQDPLGCQLIQDGRYRMLAQWVFSADSCSKLQPQPSSSNIISPTILILLVPIFWVYKWMFDWL